VIQVDDADAVLERWWTELRADGRMASLLAMAPSDRALGFGDLLPLVPLLMVQLRDSDAQLAALDAISRAYARAAGLHFTED
jgi:hypothetical protein